MLRQEINLYKSLASPPPTKTFLSWKLFLVCNASFVVVFILIYIFSWIETLGLTQTNTKLLAQAKQLENTFYNEKKKYPAVFFSENVTQSIHDLKQKLGDRAKILATITKSAPLSHYFEVLSKITTPNVWITNISIKNQGTDITLKGKSLRMDNLQLYLSNIMKDKAFMNYSMNLKDIENTSKNDTINGELNFEINLMKKTS